MAHSIHMYIYMYICVYGDLARLHMHVTECINIITLHTSLIHNMHHDIDITDTCSPTETAA